MPYTAVMCCRKMEFVTCALGGLKLRYHWDILTQKSQKEQNSMGCYMWAFWSSCDNVI